MIFYKLARLVNWSKAVIWSRTHLDKTFSIDLDTRPDEGTGGRGSSHGLPLSTVSSFGLHLRKDSSLGLAFCKLLLLFSLRTLALLLLSSTSWLLPGEELPARPLATVGPSSEATARLSDSLLPDELSLLPEEISLLPDELSMLLLPLLLLAAVSDSLLCANLSLLTVSSLLFEGEPIFGGAARESGSFLCCFQVPECDRRPPLQSLVS